jgi:flavin reductase (DIM6/NTAB) family NADH-FMN oxidoreductase RutF
VTVVSTHWRGADHAITATAFCSVSLEPPLVLVCVGKASRFHRVITEADGWAVSLLSHHQGWVGRHFADRERDLTTQFSRVPHSRAARSQAPLPTGSRGWLDCTTYALYDGGDHTIVVGQVVQAGRPDGPDAPLTYHRATYSDVPPNG